MKKLSINWLDLEMAFEDQAEKYEMERTHIFDLETGSVVLVDEEVLGAVDRVMDELDVSVEEGADVTDSSIRNTHTFQELTEDQKPSVLAAIKMQYGNSSQLEVIPRFDSDIAYQFMQDFIETVGDDTKRSQLSDAILQRKPFRHFRRVLAVDRRLQRQWREFEITRQGEKMTDWLQSIGVEPANRIPAKQLPPLPDLRKIMFAEVRRFVRFARHIPGVCRIALIGSLATDGEFPKDIDLVVTVNDDCDLTPLAQLARQLSGHMNSHSAGADVFLSSEDGKYLGRTCPWKNCGPGFRVSCDAMHCGMRPYLHDDLNATRLNEKLIAQPPVLLWPVPRATENVPLDVRHELVEQLEQDEKR